MKHTHTYTHTHLKHNVEDSDDPRCNPICEKYPCIRRIQNELIVPGLYITSWKKIVLTINSDRIE